MVDEVFEPELVLLQGHLFSVIAVSDDDDDDDDEDEDENAIATALMMRGAGSVGQLGREFWSQCHWSSGFAHRMHS